MSDKPHKKVVLQTESVRIIHVDPVPSMENAHRAHTIIVESRARDMMDEPYWEFVGELSSETVRGNKLGAAMQTLFNELLGKQHNSQLDLAYKPPFGPLSTVERHAYKPPSRDMLGMFLIELSTMFTSVEPGAVLGGMPFDNRENVAGISIDPGLMTKLRRVFPKLTTVGILGELLKCAARELADV